MKKEHGSDESIVKFNGIGYGVFSAPGSKKSNFQCDECDFEAPNSWKLKRHKESKHKQDLGLSTYVCDQCGSKIKDNWKLQRHAKIGCNLK